MKKVNINEAKDVEENKDENSAFPKRVQVKMEMKRRLLKHQHQRRRYLSEEQTVWVSPVLKNTVRYSAEAIFCNLYLHIF